MTSEQENIEYWFKCPDCKGRGTVDLDQYQGKVSIVCECGFHGYREQLKANPTSEVEG